MGQFVYGRLSRTSVHSNQQIFFSPTGNKPDIPTSLIRIHRELGQLVSIRNEYSLPKYSWSGVEVQFSLLAVSTKNLP